MAGCGRVTAVRFSAVDRVKTDDRFLPFPPLRFSSVEMLHPLVGHYCQLTPTAQLRRLKSHEPGGKHTCHVTESNE